jgi:hypothetical protein
MMMTEMDIETSVYYVHLTRLIAREDFIKFTRRESTKTYKVQKCCLYYYVFKVIKYLFQSKITRTLKLLHKRCL